MPPPSVCRLCINKCLNFKKLYKENGHCTDETNLIQKYLNDTILNLELAKHLTVICSQCWHHILDFHNFQQCVILAQKKLGADVGKHEPKTELVAKQEIKHRLHDNIPITIEDESIPSSQSVEENCVQTSDAENDTINHPLLPQDTATNDNNTNTFAEDSDDPLTDFLGFDVKSENDPELIDVQSSDSSHSSDVEMIITPNANSGSIKTAAQWKASAVRTNQSPNAAASNSNLTSRQHLNSYKKTSNKELDALVHEFMPNISCRECLEDFSSYSSMRSHFRKKHPKLEFYLKCCNLKLKNRGCVEGHFRNHKNPRYFKCDLCDRSYSLKKYLNVHIMQCHPEIRHARTHNCPKCRQAFALQYFMKLHMKTCNGDRAGTSSSSTDQPPRQAPSTSSQFFQGEVGDYVCNICEKVCTNIVALRKHTWYHHRAEHKHKCSFCGKSFQQRVEWREHMAIQHTGEHLYACPNCPNTFLRRSGLLNHQKDMHGIKSGRSCCTPPQRCPMHIQTVTQMNTNSE